MRRFHALIALGLALTSCALVAPSGSSGDTSDTTSTTSTSSTGGAGGSVASHPCDNKKSCSDCQTCSSNVICAQLFSACAQNSACIAIDQCFDGCGTDAACKEQCYLLGPDGEATYRALRKCVFCDACPSDCAGYMVCN